jgi:hypothetical protein
MARPREIIALLLYVSVLMTPVSGASSSSLGTVVYADRAHVGAAAASVGTTVFSGDSFRTEGSGSVQIRAGAARLLLAGQSMATFDRDNANPSATLTLGSATFSTANSKAFSLHVASATIRPNTDEPTIGLVTVLGPKELVVQSTRGSLTVAVEDDLRVIPEGAAYRIVLDRTAALADPQSSGGYGGRPVKAAKSRFSWAVVALVTGATLFAVSEALESPDRP